MFLLLAVLLAGRPYDQAPWNGYEPSTLTRSTEPSSMAGKAGTSSIPGQIVTA